MRPKVKPDDPAQSKRFIETAKEIGVKEDPELFEKAFNKVLKGGPTAADLGRKSSRK